MLGRKTQFPHCLAVAVGLLCGLNLNLNDVADLSVWERMAGRRNGNYTV